jgi:hypothetical protein
MFQDGRNEMNEWLLLTNQLTLLTVSATWALAG